MESTPRDILTALWALALALGTASGTKAQGLEELAAERRVGSGRGEEWEWEWEWGCTAASKNGAGI